MFAFSRNEFGAFATGYKPRASVSQLLRPRVNFKDDGARFIGHERNRQGGEGA